MKMTILISILLVVALLTGVYFFEPFAPRIDATTNETFSASLDIMNKSLSEKQQKKLSDAIFQIMMLNNLQGGGSFKNPEAQAASAHKLYYESFHNKTYRQLIAQAKNRPVVHIP